MIAEKVEQCWYNFISATNLFSLSSVAYCYPSCIVCTYDISVSGSDQEALHLYFLCGRSAPVCIYRPTCTNCDDILVVVTISVLETFVLTECIDVARIDSQIVFCKKNIRADIDAVVALPIWEPFHYDLLFRKFFGELKQRGNTTLDFYNSLTLAFIQV